MNSKHPKIDDSPSHRLEIENKMMEERLNQLKTEFAHDKEKRNAMGGTIWQAAQPGPLKGYAKNVLKNNEEQTSLLKKIAKPTNRQIKLQVLKDEFLSKKISSLSAREKEKKSKCGQCEKSMAFTRCLDCNEDYCANCFTSFHLKGALQRHRTTAIPKDMQSSARSTGSADLQFKSDSDNSFVSTDSRSILRKNGSDKPLLNGVYDEKDAQESFQKALLDWRKGGGGGGGSGSASKGRKRVQIVKDGRSRDANINTDLNEGEKKKLELIQKLEAHITSNHALSYGDRLLLQKFRRNQLEFSGQNCDEKSSTPELDKSLRQTINLAHSQHINFDSLMNGLKTDRNFEKENKMDQKWIDGKTSPEYVGIQQTEAFRRLNSSLQIEEIKTEPRGKKAVRNSSNKNLEPELIPPPPLENNLGFLETPTPRKNSFYPSSRPGSSRSGVVQTKAKAASKTQEAAELESNLSRTGVSAALKSIASRKSSDFSDKPLNGIGNFLTLSVVENSSSEKERNHDNESVSSRPISSKLSHKFYTMSPRSWKPTQSQTSPSLGGGAKEQANSEAKNIAKPTSSLNAKLSSSAHFREKKPLDLQTLPDELKRNKSFHSTIKTKKTKEEKRPATSRDRVSRPASRINMALSSQFIRYDIDDGRSSKILQNEEDTAYYGELEKEFKQVCSKSDWKEVASLNENINSIIHSEMRLKDLSESFSASASKKNEQATSIEDYEDDSNSDLESFILEEVKQLK